MKVARPVCGKEGTLQEKITVMNSRCRRHLYKKQCCRHTVGSKRPWHYLTPQMIGSLDVETESTGMQERQSL